jgi:hypothetical protein
LIPCKFVCTYLSHPHPQPTGPALLCAPRLSVGATTGTAAGGWRQTRKTSLVCPTTTDSQEPCCRRHLRVFRTRTHHITPASDQWKRSEQAPGADGLHGDDRASALNTQRRCGGLAGCGDSATTVNPCPLSKRLGKPKEGVTKLGAFSTSNGLTPSSGETLFIRSQPAGHPLPSLGP